MNTTIEAVLYTSKTLSNGQHPTLLRLTKNRKRKYISLHISLPQEQWDAAQPKRYEQGPRVEVTIRTTSSKQIADISHKRNSPCLLFSERS